MAKVSSEIDRKGAGSRFCFTRNGGAGRFVGRSWPAPEKRLKSLRYRLICTMGVLGRKVIMEIPGEMTIGPFSLPPLSPLLDVGS
jgi:hypothetical protein